MNNPKLIVFDLAGTTVRDTNTVGSCLQAALEGAGVSVTVDDVNSIMGQPKPVAIATLLERYDTDGDVDEIYKEFRRLMIETYETSPDVAEIPGTTETFVALRNKGLRVTVDTGFERDITDVVLTRMGWDDLVDDSISSDEVENGRPYPDMILELCRRAGVEPSETVKVGDTPSDIEEGRRAGAGCVVGVTYGTHTKEQLSGLEPDFIISDIRELQTLEF